MGRRPIPPIGFGKDSLIRNASCECTSHRIKTSPFDRRDAIINPSKKGVHSMDKIKLMIEIFKLLNSIFELIEKWPF
jgi:hypothetical protein